MLIYPLGDAALVIQLGDRIDEATHHRVSALSAYLNEHPIPGMTEQVPAFTTVTVFYDPGAVARAAGGHGSPYSRVRALIEQTLPPPLPPAEAETQTVEIPVCYGTPHGPDLDFVADHNGLKPEEVVEIHTAGRYRVYMIGFSPGFPYLGGMSERIAAPRREVPRLAVPAGSVGIAGVQTGVYPVETPGGWQLIGRTPMVLFRPERNPPALLTMGSGVRFRAITAREYDAWQA